MKHSNFVVEKIHQFEPNKSTPLEIAIFLFNSDSKFLKA